MDKNLKKTLDICSKMCYNAIDLCEIVEILRSENGCPWDKEQTHMSVKSDFLEETCEVIEAIENDDKALLREELGDVLLQVVFHSQIATENGDFTFGDVCTGICRKLIERHPHVFGELELSDSDAVLKNWDKIKKDTKGQSYTDTLLAVPRTLPALMRAEKIGKRAARAGMDFADLESALLSLESEVAEFRAEVDAFRAMSVGAERDDIAIVADDVATGTDGSIGDGRADVIGKVDGSIGGGRADGIGKVDGSIGGDGIDRTDGNDATNEENLTGKNDGADKIDGNKPDKNDVSDGNKPKNNELENRMAEELGDVLFSAVNVARKSGFSAEELLGQAIKKFILRFEKVEMMAKSGGTPMEELGIATLDKFWKNAK
jgi:tetrapyrrole methylase family protein/MazG family protein